MPNRAAEQVSVSCPAQITGLVHDPDACSPGSRLTAIPAGLDLGLNDRHAGAEFLLVVKRSDHDMSAFPPLRVITVVADDEALDAVIFGVHARHSSTVTLAIRSDHPQTRLS